jgi:hypothetical protein
MNLSFDGAPGLMFLVPIIAWAVSLYFIVRFLRAFERGVRAHERIADSLASSPASRSRSAFDERAP